MMTLLSRWVLGLVMPTLLVSSLSAATVVVNVVGNTFVPKVVTVNVGDTVVWQNGQNVHTVSPDFVPQAEAFCGGFAITTCSHTFTNIGSFAYHCNFHQNSHSMTGLVIVTAAPTNSGTPPTVVITNLPPNKLLAAGTAGVAGVAVGDTDGSVARVEWRTNGVACAVSSNAPFHLTLNLLNDGAHTLQAVATDDSSLSTTSAPVGVRVVTPPALQLERDNGGPGQFHFSTVPGVTYIIESAANLPDFAPQATNSGNGSVQNFFSGSGSGQRFFRLRLE
jgi:plastocyanin